MRNQFVRARLLPRRPRRGRSGVGQLTAGQQAGGSPRRGAAVVELALVVPLLAALLLGMSELGQALRVKAILAEASRKACAAGSRPGGGNADVLSEVQNVLSGAGLPANAATVTVLVNNQAGNVATAMRNDKVTVTVAIPWSAVQLTGTNAFQAGNSVQSVSTSMLKPG